MLESLFVKVVGLQVTLILNKAVNGCLVHNISLKTLKLVQGATEMFIFQNPRIKKSLFNNVRNTQKA